MKKVHISLVVAQSENQVIGDRGQIPWNIPSDRKLFAKLTKGHMVVMGRATYESLPSSFRPLPDRTNVVVTRDRKLSFPNCVMAYSWEEALAIIQSSETEVFVIGGADLYRKALPFAKNLYVTQVHATCMGDRFFPEILSDTWRVIREKSYEKTPENEYSFTYREYERISLRGSFVHLPHARVDTQSDLMQKIKEDGVCPFCPEHILSYHPNPILIDAKWWLITNIAFPYENTVHHFLIVCKEHARYPDTLPQAVINELMKLIAQLRKTYAISGGTLLWRFGDVEVTGASVDHLHAHFVVGDGTRKIKARIG